MEFVKLRVFIITCMVALFLVTMATAGEIKTIYEFEMPHVEAANIDGQVYDRVVLEKAPNGGMIGHPALPCSGAEILLPPGDRILSITVVGLGRTLVASGLQIEPVGQPAPISLAREAYQTPQPDQTIYSSNDPYPTERSTTIGTQSFRGYEYTILKLQPTEYIPATGELYYYPKLEVFWMRMLMLNYAVGF